MRRASARRGAGRSGREVVRGMGQAPGGVESNGVVVPILEGGCGWGWEGVFPRPSANSSPSGA
ncbi:hypothetical protein GCM10010357_51300 [Streptomyces luteireticuli]|uniref:Uncharacterized protein n=1 Tax=Streptomyces luteireticuli TaxID=173858 RepID=A0ABN0Z074_9ACTN